MERLERGFRFLGSCNRYNVCVTKNMDRDHFYVTLFSNASQYIYPDNKIAAFTTQLAQPIRQNPSEIWEVGLSKLSYSVTSWQPKVFDMRNFMNALMYCDLIAPQLIGTT